ncbi:hypothetical protein EDD16DRAFT_244133 [Pisolithus croceorrhizus]|nr:hypothetical protein EDD16DRAFT_244133 [Pisolithus croceorrhizus]
MFLDVPNGPRSTELSNTNASYSQRHASDDLGKEFVINLPLTCLPGRVILPKRPPHHRCRWSERVNHLAHDIQAISICLFSQACLVCPLLSVEVARPLSRSHRPLSNFFVRRREPPSLPAGTPYKRYRTTPLSIGVPHPSSDNMRSVDTDRSWPPFSSFYATDGYSKETLPVYDSVGSAPHYEEAERTFNEPSTVQPSSGGPSVPPPVYQGLQNS